MNELLGRILDAHGGMDRWNGYKKVDATIASGGGLFPLKGVPQDPSPRRMTAWLQEERSSVLPYGAPDQRTMFTPDRIAIEKLDGTLVSERGAPRDSFAGHQMSTPWDALHRAYFNGYALWTYLTTPFLLALDGVSVQEVAPVEDGGQRWRGLQARFPAEIARHSTVPEVSFGDDYLVRRHDYRVEVAGAFAAAQYLNDIIEADGVKLPSRRRRTASTAKGTCCPISSWSPSMSATSASSRAIPAQEGSSVIAAPHSAPGLSRSPCNSSMPW